MKKQNKKNLEIEIISIDDKLQLPLSEDISIDSQLCLTISSNLLFEDESVLGVSIKSSLLDKSNDVSKITIGDNLSPDSDRISIHIPDNKGLLTDPLFSGTTLSQLISINDENICLANSDYIKIADDKVLKINEPTEQSLSILGINSPLIIDAQKQESITLSATSLENLNQDDCGIVRLTSNDNLFIRDGMEVRNSILTSKINEESLLFKISKDDEFKVKIDSDYNSILQTDIYNPISLETKSIVEALDLNTLGSSLSINLDEGITLQNRFLELSDSYSSIFTPDSNNELLIDRLPKELALHTSLEYKRNVELISIISPPQVAVDEFDKSTEIEIFDELNIALYMLDSGLPKLLEGAKLSLKSDNPDKIRHFSSSLRELFTHVLHKLSPNDDFKKWTTDPKNYNDGKPTRRGRLQYICRAIDHDSFSDFVKKDIDSVLTYLKLFQGGTHSISSKLTEKQLSTMLMKMESTLVYLINTSKQ